MASKYTHDYAAFREEVLKAGFMRTEMAARAERVKAAAEAAAPVYEHGPHPGRYKASFTAGTRVLSDRVEGYVENSAPEALAVEYGTQNNPEHATLRTALNAAG